jgi:hypothetical protein
MNKKTTNTTEMLERVGTFAADHPLAPPIARAAALVILVNAAIISLRAQANDQDTGSGAVSSAAEERRRISVELRAQLRAISVIGRGLDRDVQPGLAEQLRMPRNGYAHLLTRARSFLEVVTPLKAAFVERGLSADFDTELGAKIVEFEAATQRRSGALAEKVGGTASMQATARTAVAHVRELDTILSVKYANDPGLLAAWKSAQRIRTASSTTSTATTPPPASPAAPAS